MRNKFLGTGEPGYHPLRKLRNIFAGLRYAVVYDFSVAWKLAVSLVVLAGALFARDWVDVALIIVVTALVLVAEIMNSAIEALCDFVETRHNERIGIIKDIAAAGVGIAMFAWLLVLGFEAGEMLRASSPERLHRRAPQALRGASSAKGKVEAILELDTMGGFDAAAIGRGGASPAVCSRQPGANGSTSWRPWTADGLGLFPRAAGGRLPETLNRA